MSKKEKAVTEAAEQKKDKVMTKYDLKQQKRKEAEQKAKKEAVKGKIIGAVLILALAAFILYFPISRYISLNTAYITIGEEKINRVEFDYNYALAKNTFLNSSEGSYLSMFGFDVNNIDSEMYSGDMTFKDYFDQLAVQNIADTKALKAAADAEGFTYDTNAEYDAFVADLNLQAAMSGMSLDDFVKASYGTYATLDRLEGIIRETIVTAAFYESKAEAMMPTEDEILAYYEADKANYDSVDYHMTVVDAQLPTTAPDGSVPVDEAGNEVAYEPTEEEITTAMAAAKEKAEAAVATVGTEGEAYTNVEEIYINGLVSDWLFDEVRKAGDTYVAEDNNNHRYLVVSFDKRYRDDAPTVDMRIITTSSVPSQNILDTWKNGSATEQSFIDLLNIYDEAGTASYGGMYEGLKTSDLPEGMTEWAADPARVAGDTFAIDVEGETNYVCYFVGTNDPKWQINIRSVLLSESLGKYLDEIAQGYEVQDPKGHLKYLQVAQDSSVEAVPVQ